jgi:hypothetical protein
MGEIHLDFLNFNTIILTLLILLIGGYLYYEIYNVKITLDDMNLRLNYYMNNREVDKEPVYEEPVYEEPVNDIRDSELDSSVSIPKNDIYKDVGDIKRQMDTDDDDDRHSDDSDDDSDRHSDDDSDSDSDDHAISQEEIEKDYGKSQFDNETNNASIDDILADKHIITDNSLSDILNIDNDLSNIDEFMLSMKNSEPKKEYNDMTVSELKKVLIEMSLPVSGNKTKLIERILENKK